MASAQRICDAEMEVITKEDEMLGITTEVPWGCAVTKRETTRDVGRHQLSGETVTGQSLFLDDWEASKTGKVYGGVV